MRARRRGDRPAVRALRKQRRCLPSKDPADPGFRRLRYVRYCDDHLLGFTGPKAEAQEIKIRLAAFLREELKLELSQDKTLITHARTGAARFLGYEITVQHADHKVTGKRRSINGVVGLRVPRDVIKAKCAPYLKLGKPERLNQMVNETTTRSSGPTVRSTGGWWSTTCWPVTSTDSTGWMGGEDLHAQDAGLQARLDGDPDGGPLQDHHHDTVRAAQVFRGQRRT